ncbi:hypothetical protein [Celeribacter sp.]|uniref:hypothetical protein n=1 Tax=Celeribacter sp. TaxID=1890673 RepID=UPI003A92866C
MKNSATIPLSTLHARIQDELLSLTMLAAEVQIALGPTLKNVKKLSPSVQRSFQAVDRLQQTLEDLQAVLAQLSTETTTTHVDVEPLKECIRLKHLSHKLLDNMDAPYTLAEEESGTVAWF